MSGADPWWPPVASTLADDSKSDTLHNAAPCGTEHQRYLLKALSKPTLELVFENGTELVHQNRQYLLKQGDIGDGIHIILSGVVESVYTNAQGRELMLATWQKGDFVGAPYVLGHHRHSWSARALGRVESLHLDQMSIRQLIAESPAFAVALIECLGFKGETYSTLAQTLAGQKVGERLSLLLVKLCENAAQSDRATISLGRITQANIARMIGATRQSVSLILNQLQDDGIISIKPATTIVHDLATLRERARE